MKKSFRDDIKYKYISGIKSLKHPFHNLLVDKQYILRHDAIFKWNESWSYVNCVLDQRNLRSKIEYLFVFYASRSFSAGLSRSPLFLNCKGEYSTDKGTNILIYFQEKSTPWLATLRSLGWFLVLYGGYSEPCLTWSNARDPVSLSASLPSKCMEM